MTANLAFLGALVGSIARPLGGKLADRVGGARVTLACFLGMALCTLTAIAGVNERSFGLFFASYMAIFVLAGAGNGSTYRMIPSIFDRIGGARVTLWVFVGMAALTAVAIVGVREHSFPLFFGSYMAIFLLAGMGNGSTYRMIPSIFTALTTCGLNPGNDEGSFAQAASFSGGATGTVCRRVRVK